MDNEINETEQNNVGEAIAAAPAVDPLIQKQAELEAQYKNICVNEVNLIDQLNKVQEERKMVATGLNFIKSLAG
jgi:hypothetical protein